MLNFGGVRLNIGTGLMADGTEQFGTENETYSWKRLVDWCFRMEHICDLKLAFHFYIGAKRNYLEERREVL